MGEVVLGFRQRTARNRDEAPEVLRRVARKSFGKVARCRRCRVADLIREPRVQPARTAVGEVVDQIAELDRSLIRNQILEPLDARHASSSGADAIPPRNRRKTRCRAEPHAEIATGCRPSRVSFYRAMRWSLTTKPRTNAPWNSPTLEPRTDTIQSRASSPP